MKRFCLLAAMSLILAMSGRANAEILYATSINTSQIYKVDTVAKTATSVFTASSPLDSLFFDPSGRIIYSELDNGTVHAFNPNIPNSDVTLASGLSSPIDLALEPSQTSFLVSDSNSNSLSRVSLSGGVLGTLHLGGRPDGVIYDGSGHLFVNVSSGFTANNSQVEEIDPTTGAVLHTSGNLGIFLDGLTYDSSTGMLFASDYNYGRIVEIDPTNLLSHTILTPKGVSIPGGGPDGIVSDGQGNLFIASRANGEVVQYNIATNTATNIASINGLDDLAPASGLGAPSAAPEPASLTLALLGSAGFLGYRWRSRKA